MKKIFHIILISITQISIAKSQGVAFLENQSWESIKLKAQTEHKNIFIDAYATWCVPCKRMDSEVYPNDSVGNLINKNFIAMKIQIDRTTGDNDLIKKMYKDADFIKKAYKVEVVPTLLFFNSEGEILTRGIGYHGNNDIVKLVDESLDPNEQYYTLLKLYKEGKLPINKMKPLAIKAKSINDFDMANTIGNDYLNRYIFKLKGSEIMSTDNLSFILQFIGNTKSKAFEFVMKNKTQIEVVLGENKSEYSIKKVIANDYLKSESVWPRSNSEWDELTTLLTKKYQNLGREVALGNRMMYCYYAKDWANFGKYYHEYFITALKRPDYDINTITYELFLYVDNPEILSFACDVIMKYAMEEWYQNNPAAYDTYAQLLYKTNKKSEAIMWQERAVKLKQGAPDINIYIEHLDKMKLDQPTWVVKSK